jgi:hypothetical protein
MTLEIRPIRSEELEDFVFANLYAFNEDRRPEALREAMARPAADALRPAAGRVRRRTAGGLIDRHPLTMRASTAASWKMGGAGGVACLPSTGVAGTSGRC